ncbi:MAG: flavodoxin domain-containing protein, partial [Dermatophilaceae bacterium]
IVVGIVVGITAARIGRPVRRANGLGRRLRGPLATSWPWWLAAALASWLVLVPGLPLLDVTLGVRDPMAVVYTFGAAVVLLALAICSALAHDAERTVGSEVRLSEVHVGSRQPAPGENRILVAYASRYGSTAEAAQAIGTALRDDGAAVDVTRAGDVDDLTGYDAVVVGGPIYLGSLLRDEKRFLERHEGALRDMPVAVFALGPIQASDDGAEARDQLAGALTAYPWLDPVETRLFVGRYDPQKLRLADRLVTLPPASPLRGVGAHDDRDWDAIRSWANTLEVALRRSQVAQVPARRM